MPPTFPNSPVGNHIPVPSDSSGSQREKALSQHPSSCVGARAREKGTKGGLVSGDSWESMQGWGGVSMGVRGSWEGRTLLPCRRPPQVPQPYCGPLEQWQVTREVF